MFKIRLSLRGRLLVGFVLMALVPLSVTVTYYYWSLSTQLNETVEHELKVGAELTAQRIDSFMEETGADMRAQSQIPDFADYIAAGESERVDMNLRLGTLIKSMAHAANQSYVRAYLVLDSDGRVVFDQAQVDVGVDFSSQPFFKNTLEQDFFMVTLAPSPVYLDSPSLYFTVPIWGSAQESIGILAMRYNLTVVNYLISHARELGGANSFAVLVRDDGQVVAWGEHEGELPVKQIDLSLFQTREFSRNVLLGEEQFALAVTHLKYVPLSVLYLRGERGISSFINAQLLPLFVLWVIVLAVAVFVALMVTRRLSEPIRALTETAEGLMKGDMDARVTILPADEVGLLGQTFNRMADVIQEELAEVRATQESYRQLSESLEQIVETRTQQLQKVNDELEAFSYSVSHDLRAPLRAIDGYSRILEEDAPLDDSMRSYLKRIRSSVAQMRQLIDGLLALSRLGRQALHVVPMSADELRILLDEIVSDLEAQETERVIEWRIAQLPDCHADPTLLRQVFANLLGNAYKYSRQRNPAVIEVGQENGVYFVKDNGAGFDMRYAGKLFGVFQRLHRADEFEGSGVGLATVKRIVERHGGQIWANSEEGQGAAFYFTLKS